MKPTAFLRRFLAIAGSAALTVTYTHAVTLYWDGNTTQTANADGGAGTWDNGTTTNWDTLPFGGADSVWTDGAHTAFFGATAGTVTIGTGGVTVGGLTFNTTTTAGYTLNAGTNGLNFSSGTNNINFAVHNGNAAATITGQVGGSGANLVLTTQNLTRTATLTLDGAGTGGWTGSTTINANTVLVLGSTGASNSANTSLASTSALNINGGGLTLNFGSGASMNRVSNTAPITFNGGGTVSIGTALSALSEQLGNGVTLASGQANFVYNNAPSSGGFITLPSLTRTVNTAAVTFSGNFASGANFVVTGAAVTPGGEILGPWATTGGQSGVAAQTDYAVYNGSSQIRAAGIAASAESSWSAAHSATSNFTMSAIDSGTISGGAGRNVNALRSLSNSVTVTSGNANIALASHTLAVGDLVTFSAGTMPTNLTAGTPYYVVATGAGTIQVSATAGGGAITPGSAGATVVANGGIQVSSGNNLGTFGILNGSATTLNILQSGGAGSLTLPTTAAGNLFINAGSGAISIAAPIINNTGALTLVKNGSGALTLSSTGNTYSGGTVLNAGTLNIGNVGNIGGAGASLTFNGTATMTPSAALNFSSGTLTVNQGALATIATGGNVTFATTTGAGTLAFSGSATTLNIGNASGLSGTLALLQPSGTQAIQFSSLNGNTAGSLLAFGGNANDSNQRSTFLFIGSAPLLFSSTGRQVAITPSTNSNGGAKFNFLQNNSAPGAGTPNTWVIDSDLINTGVRGNIELILDGSNTDNNAFNGAIGNTTMNGGQLWVSKTGAGKWILGGANTFTGRLVVNQGTLSVATLNNSNVAGPLGRGAVQLGGTEAAIGGGIILANNSGILEYTGGVVSSTRAFLIGDTTAANTGGGTIANNGTGAITFTAANFNTQITGITGTRTLTLSGTNTGNNEVQGIIQDNVATTGKVSFAKSGIGTWILSGSNAMTGTSNLSGGGTLVLDYGTNNNAKLASGVLTLTSGGNVILRGGSSFTESVASLTLGTGTAGGNTSISRDNSGTNKIAFGAITRSQSQYATLYLAEDNLATTTSAVVNGILTGGITVGSNWAKVSSGNIIALTSGDYTPLTGTVNAGTANYQLTGGLVPGAVTVNSLRIVGNGNDQVLDVGANAFKVSALTGTMGNGAGGGILYVGGGNDNYTITGTSASTLQAQNGNQELIINTYQGTLNVAVPLTMGIQGLTKTGAGTLNLSGAGTYSGGTFVNQGVLQLKHNAAAGTTGAITVHNAAALELANSVAIGNKALTITGNGSGSNTGALRNVANNSSSYAGAITIGTGGARINSDANGALTLSNGVVTSLFNNVTFGGAGNTTVSTGAISGGGGVIKDGTGNLILSATNTYVGTTTISGGTLRFATQGSLYNNIAASWTAANLNVKSGATVAFNVGGASEFTTGDITTLLTNLAASSSATNGMNADSNIGINTQNASGGTFTIGDVIANTTGASGGARGLTKLGLNELILTGNNSYSGGTILNQGTLTVGTGGTLGATTGGLVVNNNNSQVAGNNAILNLATAVDTTVGSLSGTIATPTSGTNTATINTQTGRTFTVNQTSAGAYAGVIAGAGNFSLGSLSTNTLTLNGINTYTGLTTISGTGTLKLGVAGSIDNSSGVALGTAGIFDVSAKVGGYAVTKLTGSGTVIGALTISTELAIGNSPGVVTTTGDLTLGSSSISKFDVTGGATDADLGDVNGLLTIVSGATLDLVQLGTYTVDDKFTLFAYDTLSGTFAGLADGAIFTDADGDWRINYYDNTPGLNGGSGSLYVTITAIPEPGAALIGGLGLLALLRRRRN